MRRRYLTAARLRELAVSLSARDYAVIRELAALRFLSGSQAARLCFAGSEHRTDAIRAARRALLRLNRLEVVDRLPRAIGGEKPGSASFVYCLAPAGQRLAAQCGWLPDRRTRRVLLPGRLFVTHALAVAELHTRLVEGARAGRIELLERAAEPACWRQFSGVTIKPDSYLRLGVGDFEDSYFIEVDQGTEGSRAIDRQLECYLAYHATAREQAERGVFPKVLWLASDTDRAEVLADLIGRQPHPAGELFAVAEFDQALNVVSEKPQSGVLENTL